MAQGGQADEAALQRVDVRTRLEAYVHRCRQLLKDKDLRGRMEDDDSDRVRMELETTDEGIDANQHASADETESKLDALREGVGGVFRRYDVAVEEGDSESVGFDDDLGEPGDHDEL